MDDRTLLIDDPALQHRFVSFPRSVLLAATLSAGARLLYAILMDFAWQKAQAWPGQERLCELMGVSEKTLRMYLQELYAAKLLSAKRRGRGLTNIYHLLPLGKSRLEPAQNGKKSRSRTGNPPVLEREKIPPNIDEVKLDKGEAAARIDSRTSKEPEPDAAAATSLAQAMVDAGVDAPVAKRLAAEYPGEVVTRQLEYLPHRTAADPAALLVKAIQGDWPDPRLRHARGRRPRVASQAAYRPSEVDWEHEPGL
jgi:hypothetical protein